MSMSLTHFNIAVSVDEKGGIAKKGRIPWWSPIDRELFRRITTGTGNSTMIMGRKTYEILSKKRRPPRNRINIVISTTWKPKEKDVGVKVAPSLQAALEMGASFGGPVWVIGGEQVYREALRDYSHLCDQAHVRRWPYDYECDQFFPLAALVEAKHSCKSTRMHPSDHPHLTDFFHDVYSLGK